MWHNTFAILALFVHYIIAVPTWPNSIDEIEDLMVLQSGYNAPSFGAAVTPCDQSLATGFRTAASFIRTAFHDIAAHDAGAGTNGLDASIGFELGDPYSVHNSGPGFYAAMTYYQSFFNSKASMADLIALGTYAAVRSCGGPIIPMKAGRIDATGPGENSLPDVQDSKEVFIGRFAKMGFSTQEMIQLVACGHTLGGVHPGVTSAFKPQDPNAANEAAQKGVLTFDTTDAQFDNSVAVEYMSGTTNDPLVTGSGPQEKLNSDLRVFSSDGNATISSMTDPGTFQGSCQAVMQKMLERVPSNVRLSDVIQPYDVKPGQLNFYVRDDGSLQFSGEIRVKTTSTRVASVQLVYNDKSGNACDGCSIDTRSIGSASGFDDSFSFYSFSAKVDSISSFKVAVTTTSGQVQMFDNNGNGFRVNDGAFVQVPSSSLNGQQLKVVVAVRSQQGLTARDDAVPRIVLSTRSAAQFNVLPTISQQTGTVIKICGGTKWTFYYAVFTVSSADANSAKLDVFIGSVLVDGFRDINFPSSGITPTCINAVTTTVSTSTTSSTTSSSTLTSSTTSLSTISSSTTSTSSAISRSSTIISSTSSGASTEATSTSSQTVSISGSSTSTGSSSSVTTSGFSTPTTMTSSDPTSSTTVSSVSTLTTTAGSSDLFAIDPAMPTSDTTTDKTTASSDKVLNISGTSTKSASVNDPVWGGWEPASSSSGSASSGSVKSSSIISNGKGSSTSDGDNYSYATPNVPKPSHGDAQAAMASVFASLANKPAPSGGTDGGNQNVAGLDLNIQVSNVKVIITGTTAVYTNTVVYVTTYANAQESANVHGGAGGADVTGIAKPTGAGSPGVSEEWGSWSAPGASLPSGSATPTKTGPIAKYTGAADSLRSCGVAVGLVAALGAVVVML